MNSRVITTAYGRPARAARRPYWRESYVGTVRQDGTVLEGFVDLIYREDDGDLKIVDDKTDDIPEAADASRAAFYAPPMAAYQAAINEATDDRATSTLLFLHPSQPSQIEESHD